MARLYNLSPYETLASSFLGIVTIHKMTIFNSKPLQLSYLGHPICCKTMRVIIIIIIIIIIIYEDNGVREKEDEKVEKYQDLAREARKMWGVRTKVIPVVVGALGSIPLRLNDNLRAIEVGIPVGLIQRCALLGSARILRNVLEM